MNKKNPVGRPSTGRKLARYWMKKETVVEISRRTKALKMEREADYLENLIGKTA